MALTELQYFDSIGDIVCAAKYITPVFVLISARCSSPPTLVPSQHDAANKHRYMQISVHLAQQCKLDGPGSAALRPAVRPLPSVRHDGHIPFRAAPRAVPLHPTVPGTQGAGGRVAGAAPQEKLIPAPDRRQEFRNEMAVDSGGHSPSVAAGQRH